MDRPIVGTKSMIVSPHYLASMAGNSILEKGGNAFDAAVAVAACLGVVYPAMTGPGGDSFWLTYSPKEGKVNAYNGAGRSGSKVTRELYEGEESIPFRGIRAAITVPGQVDAWDAIISKYGKLTLKEALQPAIDYALNGFPYTRDQYVNTKKNLDVLSKIPITKDTYTPNGQVPRVGSRFVQENLGKSLQLIAEQGRDVFYKGELGDRIINYIQENGGYLVKEDFEKHKGFWTEPISTTYRGYDMYQFGPPTQGLASLMTLNILENFDFSKIEHGSFEYYHLLVEALKLSFEERNAELTDPEFHKIPLDRILSKEYARQKAEQIRSKASSLDSAFMGADTAYAAVVDEEGNAVSFILSIYHEYGSGIVAGDTGILMQNRGSFFSLDPNHVNTLEPNKFTFTTIIPAMACKDGKPYILYGTQGGEGQPQTQTAMITRMLEYGMDPQEAVSQPRWLWGRTWGVARLDLKIESRCCPNTIQALRDAGHDVNVVKDYDDFMGHASAIKVDDDGFLQGGVDPRSDGAAIGR
ncbi:gamma-glutamyltransferase [Ammoniphilus oxalaticus]|uniref:Glutathione hydrolase proenzyme n=1 Tax=Ammoniphilus oxalaticus TaxID=66863 RepID=A0A419SL09_9BACL|nr:gamma-glutamyltransferase [Ammoniphilus oxalaticus]RKD24672.1 gamma-glutamyltransferase [Ammoniphilus oxalaticus]